MKISKRSIIISISIPIIVASLIFVYNEFFSNPQVKIIVGNMMVQEYKNPDGTPYYTLNFSLNPVIENGKIITLYNCQYTVRYLAINGTWVSKTQFLGTQDFDWWRERQFVVPMEDFKLDPNHMTIDGIYAGEQQSVEVIAYGYKKP
ncbi:MAG: hypothetical protein ACPLKZ_07620 [Candidatus Bathyarchaeales archaeon]